MIAFLISNNTCCPSSKAGKSAIFSATVFPVTVKQSPCNIPFSSINFITAGVPPTLCKSSIKYFPEGFKSANTGVLSLNFWMSSIVNFNPTECAIAIKCKTAFVDPPRTKTILIAFSNAFIVIISLGLISFSNKIRIAFPASSHSFFFSSLKAGLEELNGKLIPKASIAEAIVFAVYIPPQAPAPGQAFLMIPLKSSGVILLFIFLPSASKADTIFNCSPFHSPG